MDNDKSTNPNPVIALWLYMLGGEQRSKAVKMLQHLEHRYPNSARSKRGVIAVGKDA